MTYKTGKTMKQKLKSKKGGWQPSRNSQKTNKSKSKKITSKSKKIRNRNSNSDYKSKSISTSAQTGIQ